MKQTLQKARVEFTGPQMSQLLHAISAYLDDADDMDQRDVRVLSNAEREIRQARERWLEFRMKAGLRR